MLFFLPKDKGVQTEINGEIYRMSVPLSKALMNTNCRLTIEKGEYRIECDPYRAHQRKIIQ